MRSGRSFPWWLPLAAIAASSCQGGLTAGADPAELDEAYFRCRVQPVLTRSCSQLACHGDPQRFFHFFARNRLRLSGDESERNAFLSDEERAFNFAMARAFVEPQSPSGGLLVEKPLEQASGGAFHVGATQYGAGDVFTDRDDRGFETLVAWVAGAIEEPGCVEPGSDL